ncbi:MAG: Holliday junction resolvase RuvX [Halochromatium sp.]|uniref:Holliday junction resolvase RuvX n=1 Tax=Halochromatium sp. TaxID=2049430 RepID=UPI003978F0FF
MATLLGFDFGPRKIGVAIGQTVTGTATALETVRAQGQRPDWKRLEAIIREWQPQAAVVGLPFNMDDSEETWSSQVHRFARQLEGRFGLRVHLVDERLTSLAARRQLRVDANTADDRIDAQAAKLILETWLAEAPSPPSSAS